MEFEIEGRRLAFAARTPASDEFRVLVDGVPIPMDVTRTETYTGNIRTRTSEIEARHPAPWVRVEGTPSEPEVRNSRAAYIYFRQPTGYVYNTAVWQSGSVSLTFADDFSRVEIVVNASVDIST